MIKDNERDLKRIDSLTLYIEEKIEEKRIELSHLKCDFAIIKNPTFSQRSQFISDRDSYINFITRGRKRLKELRREKRLIKNNYCEIYSFKE